MNFLFLILSFFHFCLNTQASPLIENGEPLAVTDRLSVVRVEIKPYLGEREKNWLEKINDYLSAWTCTATIVSPRVVLTAKHCLKTYPIEITDPDHSHHMRFQFFVGGKMNKAIQVIGVHQNPDRLFYNKHDEANANIRLRFVNGDFAALILSEASAKHITKEMISPINVCATKAKEAVHVVGFGYTNKWNEIMAQVTAIHFYKSLANGRLGKDTDYYFLSKNANDNIRTTEGDSGAPLFNQAKEIIAISSSGIEEGNDFHSLFAPLNSKQNKAVLATLVKKGLLKAQRIKCL